MPAFEDKFEGLRKLREVRDGGGAQSPFSTPEPPQVNMIGQGGGIVGSPGIGGISMDGGLQQAVRRAAARYGWGDNEWGALNTLIQKESSWNPQAQNPTSTAWGLFQFLDMHWGPGRYLPRGRNSSVPEQIAGGLRYIKDRYGSPSRALAFHLRNNWY